MRQTFAGTSMLSPNTILRERYRIIHQLGHGGMGAVYQAMDGNRSCVVAVKETFATTDEQRRAFRREAELLANLSNTTLRCARKGIRPLRRTSPSEAGMSRFWKSNLSESSVAPAGRSRTREANAIVPQLGAMPV